MQGILKTVSMYIDIQNQHIEEIKCTEWSLALEVYPKKNLLHVQFFRKGTNLIDCKTNQRQVLLLPLLVFTYYLDLLLNLEN